MDAAVRQAVQDFGRSGGGNPLYATGDAVSFVLPASAEKLIRQGAKALPALERDDGPVSWACIMIIQAKEVQRGKTRPRNGVKLVCYTVVPSTGRTDALWCLNRETKAVEQLIHDADICLEANEGKFTRTKPLGPDGQPVYAFGNGVLPASVMPPTNTCSREAVVVRIPEDWIIRQGTTNASGTGMEDFTLDVVTKIKACGVRRVTAYMRAYGDCCRVFDGEVPSRKAIDEWAKRGVAIGEGL
jgi:hypothetical protein